MTHAESAAQETAMSEISNGRNGKEEKCDGEGDAKPPSAAAVLGGPMYDVATARKMLKGVRSVYHKVEPRIVHREGPGTLFGVDMISLSYGSCDMSRKGFDPDDAALDIIYIILMPKGERNSNWQQLVEVQVTPMIYYAMNGNVKMCRYLISRGASSTKTVEGYLHSPMQTAAKHGHLDICKLLFHNGDKHHIRSVSQDGLTPFHFSVYWSAKRGHDDFVRWFVLHGALCSDDDSEDIVGGMIHSVSYGKADITICITCSRLVDWSKDVLQAHSSVITFLLGTQPPIPDNDRECILQCLSGHPGIRKSIADFVGLEVTKTKQLHILRSVVEVLPEAIRIGRKKERMFHIGGLRRCSIR